jgi:hypothetical protein
MSARVPPGWLAASAFGQRLAPPRRRMFGRSTPDKIRSIAGSFSGLCSRNEARHRSVCLRQDATNRRHASVHIIAAWPGCPSAWRAALKLRGEARLLDRSARYQGVLGMADSDLAGGKGV